MIDFRGLYDQMGEYVNRRDPASYHAQRIALEVAHFKVPHLVAALPPGFTYRTVAEIGCATGELLAAFPGAEAAHKVGFDISPLNIAAAAARFPGITFLAEDFRHHTEVFDLVILSDILEHVPDDAGFLRSAAKRARRVVVNLPLEKCLSYAFRRYGPEDSSGHLRNYSYQEGLDLFVRAGLTVECHHQQWTVEGEYEYRRQDLSRRLLGAVFRGNAISQTAKALAFGGLTRFRWLRRWWFASNLFASACGEAGCVAAQ